MAPCEHNKTENILVGNTSGCVGVGMLFQVLERTQNANQKVHSALGSPLSPLF